MEVIRGIGWLLENKTYVRLFLMYNVLFIAALAREKAY
jgi:hypothetical protein